MSVRSVVPSTGIEQHQPGILSWMSVRSVVPSTKAGQQAFEGLVLDECQISSSEYLVAFSYLARPVLDECQISSSEYATDWALATSSVLDECQISSSEY